MKALLNENEENLKIIKKAFLFVLFLKSTTQNRIIKQSIKPLQ